MTYHKFQVVPANQTLVYTIEKSLLDSYRLIKGKYEEAIGKGLRDLPAHSLKEHYER